MYVMKIQDNKHISFFSLLYFTFYLRYVQERRDKLGDVKYSSLIRMV